MRPTSSRDRQLLADLADAGELGRSWARSAPLDQVDAGRASASSSPPRLGPPLRAAPGSYDPARPPALSLLRGAPLERIAPQSSPALARRRLTAPARASMRACEIDADGIAELEAGPARPSSSPPGPGAATGRHGDRWISKLGPSRRAAHESATNAGGGALNAAASPVDAGDAAIGAPAVFEYEQLAAPPLPRAPRASSAPP